MHAGVLSRKVDGDMKMRQLSSVKVMMRQRSAAALRHTACNSASATAASDMIMRQLSCVKVANTREGRSKRCLQRFFVVYTSGDPED